MTSFRTTFTSRLCSFDLGNHDTGNKIGAWPVSCITWKQNLGHPLCLNSDSSRRHLWICSWISRMEMSLVSVWLGFRYTFEPVERLRIDQSPGWRILIGLRCGANVSVRAMMGVPANLHEEAHRCGENLIHDMPSFAPCGRRRWLRCDDVSNDIGHDRAHDIVQSDVSDLALHVPSLVLRHARDSIARSRPRERLLAKLHVL